MQYSLIIPVYNRPDEVRELLHSLREQTFRDFEVIVVEDGSQIGCENEVLPYTQSDSPFAVRYFTKPNSGPGQSRNFGAEHAQGEWLIILDSDIIVPKGYLAAVDQFLQAHPDTDAWGGPDRAHDSFTPIQKAINYAMTSFFTTGGIRGGKRKLDTFYPRSFNMGIRREVYKQLGGFRNLRFGEDIDFSYRIVEAGCQTALISAAFVYHKRRSTLRQFFKQVHNSGRARVNLSILHPHTLKLVHLLPTAFTIGMVLLMIGGVWWQWLWMLLLCYMVLIGIDSSIRNHSLSIGLLSIAASFVQLIGYGTGFMAAAWRQWVLQRENQDAFTETFYK